MSPLEAAGPNAAQIEYWNERTGPRWVRLAEAIDAQIGPLGLAGMQRLALGAGMRVLDVGCGCGATTLELARRVGPRGAVTGIDVSAPMLGRARERAREAGLGNASFVNADAQTHAFEPGAFDRLFSRFGIMFFADPRAAFSNLGRALAPAGCAVFLCWQELARNPWMLVPALAAAEHVPLPPRPEPGAPGPFALADGARLCGLLRDAGFAHVTLEPLEGELAVGGSESLADAARFALEVGPAAAALREAGEPARPAVEAAVRAALAPFHSSAGVRMPYAAWRVEARASGTGA